ncbi:MSCRAMM family protein, partial [Methanosphaera sp.]
TKQPVPNGPVVAKVNGTVVGTGEVINGTAIIPTDLDKIGDYDVELEYLGNENYTESNTTVPVDVVGRPSDITAEPGNETLGNSTVNITLVDPETNEPIPFAPVIITLPDGTQVNGTTDENGTVEVPVDLPVGPHTLNVTYPGNETYAPSNTTVDMNILPRPSEIEAELINNTAGNVTIKATVTDAETGELVPNGPVEVYVNGTLVGTGEVVDGIAIIKTNITEIGNYDFDVEYLGNENYTESNTTVNDDVVGRPSDITAEPGREELGNSTVNITLVDPETNEPIPNAPVIITLPDGTNVTGTTDENGFVEVPVDLPAGNHTLVVTYPGNETYSPSNTTVDMEILPLPTVIEPEVINPVIGEREIELVLKDPETGDLLANKPVVITLPDGSTINATTDENGKVRTPVDLPAGENELIISFAGDDKYSPSTAPLVVDVVKRNATLTPTVRENVNGTAVVDILAVDDLTGKPVVNGTIELTLADGTKVTAITDENGIATFTGVNVPVGETVYDAKLIENPIYNKAVTDVTIDNVPRMINIGNWTLIRVNVPVDNGTDDVVPGEPDTVKPVPRNKGKVAPRVRSVNKYQQRTSKYNRYNRYSRYTSRYNKRPSWNRPSRGIPVPVPAMTKEQYILFITLYGELLEGDISFSDFMVVLKLNGIEIASTNAWDENGQITLTYDDISEVPDSIEIQDNSGHFSDYNSDIEKDNAPSSSGEIDSGDINVEQKSSSSSASKASDSVSNTASESASAAEA